MSEISKRFIVELAEIVSELTDQMVIMKIQIVALEKGISFQQAKKELKQSLSKAVKSNE